MNDKKLSGLVFFLMFIFLGLLVVKTSIFPPPAPPQGHLVASGQPQQVPQERGPPSASVLPITQQVSSDIQ